MYGEIIMINILVVDDSAFMRKVIKEIINTESNLNVVDTARNGERALKKINKYKPDVVTMDVEMPEKNGLETLKEIMNSEYKTIPVIMISALDNSKIVMEALEIGAFDFIPKPSGSISLDIEEIGEELILKVKSAIGSKKKQNKHIKKINRKITSSKNKKFPIVAIGSSSGGPKTLKQLLTSFPRDFPGAIIIVQHMPAGFTESLANRLNQVSDIKIKEASKGDTIKPGVALIAPGDYHLEIDKSGKVKLDKRPKKWGVRPCVDYMMTSVAYKYRERVIGIILTGMGHDGAVGMQDIKKNKGYGIVEDKSTALVYGMPGAVIKVEAYDKILPVDKIPQGIIDVIERRF